MAKYGEKLQTLRKERDLTVKEVAYKMGIPQSRMLEIEREVRIPSAGQISRLEQFFGTPTGEIAALVN